MRVFPNPTSGKLTIVSSEDNTIEIVNVIGEIVFTKELHNEKTEIDISTLPNGIYFVKTGTSIYKIIKEE